MTYNKRSDFLIKTNNSVNRFDNINFFFNLLVTLCLLKLCFATIIDSFKKNQKYLLKSYFPIFKTLIKFKLTKN